TRSIAALQPRDFHDACARGGVIRQLAFAEYDRVRSALTAWVAPAVVPQSSIYARTVGPQNAAVISGEHAGDIGVFGARAGGPATAVAAIGDLLAIARDRAAIVPAPVLATPSVINGLDRGTNIVDLCVRPENHEVSASPIAEAV